ncbi:bifunctional MaoC family dehydratase N-terminal/OB-fold nucleic acid binding domain-containing protein [Streptomyces sp. NPDC002935]|uniref:bifunctional MaoC family dehydratase N-terminal/OB-fold nucleic acid binding domain-containing protein n=1 Tax=unclassified Streptomyces TaxID=2593676 RepID=UPI00331A95AD
MAVRLKGYEGRAATVGGVGKDPVNLAMIRHWCEAMGDTSPAYDGPDAVAPPTMLQAWTMGGLRGHPGRSGAYDELLRLLDGAGYTSVVATDCEQEYLRPLRPGDEITFDGVIESVSERKTTKLGTGYFVTTRMDIRAGGELAGTHRFRILKYVPAQRNPKGPAEARDSSSTVKANAEEAKSRRPRPVINRDNAGFWEGVERHRLLIQRCTGCGTLRFPWLPGCGACGSPDWDTVESGGEGTVYSYVVMHHPPFPAFDPPYAVGLIELAEGVRMVSNVVGVSHDQVRIGMPVRLEFQRYDEELELPVFRAQEGRGDDDGPGDSAAREPVGPAGPATREALRSARTAALEPRGSGRSDRPASSARTEVRSTARSVGRSGEGS